jgi:hypothetical protein
MERGRSARTTHVARVTSLPHEPSHETLMTNYMGNFFYRGPDTFALCASYCKSDPTRCKAFRYSYWADADAQYCESYDFGL